MTRHAMVTIVAPVAIDAVEDARELISQTLGNPASHTFNAAISPVDAAPFLHFASLHAVAASAGDTGYLILEFSADGEDIAAINELAARTGAMFRDIFAKADGFSSTTDIAAYWQQHQIKIGYGMFDAPGLAFSGTPGLSVETILEEHRLTDHVRGLLNDQAIGSSQERLEAVRSSLQGSEFEWALTNPPTLPSNSKKPPSTFSIIGALAGPFLRHFAWPIALITLLFSTLLNWPEQWVWSGFAPFAQWGFAEWVRTIGQILGFTLGTVGLIILFSAIIFGAIYAKLRRQEESDWVSDKTILDDDLRPILANENAHGHVQNHMMSHTVRKPGWLRKMTTRLAFFVVANLTALRARPGFLGDIGTIHFARWITIPGTRDFIFFSNYGGSWESYLEDFITKAHEGLTAVWSNAIGFPRSKNLIQGGATQAEPFKRYARHSMISTPFWYCAYPGLSTANIRANHRVRSGLATASGCEEASEWLEQFGSQSRPQDKLETSQMQSLLFGGMGFKPEGRLMLIELADDAAKNRELLDELMPFIAFGDGRFYLEPALITFATSAAGLAKLGLPDDALSTFPSAFREGMNGAGRDRILGDLGNNAAQHWRWGRDGNDLALLIYGDAHDAKGEVVSAIDLLDEVISQGCERASATISRRIDLAPAGSSLRENKEPFGFVDGVSQPAMRGTYRGHKYPDPLHLIEPGELVLGYPDNRGNMPPSPMMQARHDPNMLLPTGGEVQGSAQSEADNPRLFANNGSFLVIRQLEQDVQGFDQYCAEEGERLSDAFPDIPVTADMKEFVGAKMIGRWKDGSSIARYPYISESDRRKRLGKSSDFRIDNDFVYGVEDPQGLKCPFGAHIRRTNPRDSLSPGSSDQIDISNRHRILRVGRGYQPDEPEDNPGIMFMCLNADLERQFEFIQQTWMQNSKFHGLNAEVDPLAVTDVSNQSGFTIPTGRGPVMLKQMPQFVTMLGGGYFFVPGRQLLTYLSKQ